MGDCAPALVHSLPPETKSRRAEGSKSIPYHVERKASDCSIFSEAVLIRRIPLLVNPLWTAARLPPSRGCSFNMRSLVSRTRPTGDNRQPFGSAVTGVAAVCELELHPLPRTKRKYAGSRPAMKRIVDVY